MTVLFDATGKVIREYADPKTNGYGPRVQNGNSDFWEKVSLAILGSGELPRCDDGTVPEGPFEIVLKRDASLLTTQVCDRFCSGVARREGLQQSDYFTMMHLDMPRLVADRSKALPVNALTFKLHDMASYVARYPDCDVKAQNRGRPYLILDIVPDPGFSVGDWQQFLMDLQAKESQLALVRLIGDLTHGADLNLDTVTSRAREAYMELRDQAKRIQKEFKTFIAVGDRPRTV